MKTKTTSYGGLKIAVLDQKNEFVPKFADRIKLKPKDRKALAISIQKNIPCLLIGETGTGKTSAIRELAKKRKQGYTRISLTGYTTPDDLIGTKSVKDGSTYYENGILTNAMINGHICVLDELNAITPDSSFIVHGLLDDDKRIALPNGDIIKPHEDFRLFATLNPDYEGTKTINRAFLDRFGIIIYVDLLTPKNEIKLLKNRTGINVQTLQKMVATAWLNRKAYKENKTLTIISTRSLLQWGFLINEGLKDKEAYISAIGNKARTEEKRAFLDFYNATFKAPSEDDEDVLPEVIMPEEVKRRRSEIEDYQKNINTYYESERKHMRKIDKVNEKNKDLKKINKLQDEKITRLENASK